MPNRSEKTVCKPSLADFAAVLVNECNLSSLKIEKEGNQWVVHVSRRGDRPSAQVKDAMLHSAFERLHYTLVSWREGE